MSSKAMKRHAGTLNIMHMTKWQKPILKDYVQYDSKYMTFWKRQTMETVKGSVVVKRCGGGVEKGLWRDVQAEPREFLGQWKCSLWYHNDGYMLYFFSKPTKRTSPRVTCNVNYGLWSWRLNVDSSVVTNIPLWWGILIMREDILSSSLQETTLSRKPLFLSI